MRENIIGWVKLYTGGAAGVGASLVFANQLLGTLAALLTIAFAIWRHLKDRDYVKKREDRVKRKLENESNK